MNGRRWKRIALLTALGVMLVVVGVLVWPEPKEARGEDIWMSVWIFDTDTELGVQGLDVWIRLYNSQNQMIFDELMDDDQGLYSLQVPYSSTEFDHWNVIIWNVPAFLTDFISDPNPTRDYPSLTTSIQWEVQDTRQ